MVLDVHVTFWKQRLRNIQIRDAALVGSFNPIEEFRVLWRCPAPTSRTPAQRDAHGGTATRMKPGLAEAVRPLSGAHRYVLMYTSIVPRSQAMRSLRLGGSLERGPRRMHYAFLIVLSWSPADQFSLCPHSAHAYYTALELLAIYISKPSVQLAVCASRPRVGPQVWS